MGTCAAGPVLLVEPDGIVYTKMDPAKVADVVQRHLLDDEVCMEYTFYDAYRKKRVPKLEDISFFREQVRVALRNCGRMEYGSLDPTAPGTAMPPLPRRSRPCLPRTWWTR